METRKKIRASSVDLFCEKWRPDPIWFAKSPRPQRISISLFTFQIPQPLAVGQDMRKRGLGGNYVSPQIRLDLFRFDTPSACGGELHFGGLLQRRMSHIRSQRRFSNFKSIHCGSRHISSNVKSSFALAFPRQFFISSKSPSPNGGQLLFFIYSVNRSGP